MLCYNKGEAKEEEGTNGHNDGGEKSRSHTRRWRCTHVTSRGTPAIMNGMRMECLCECVWVCENQRDREKERGERCECRVVALAGKREGCPANFAVFPPFFPQGQLRIRSVSRLLRKGRRRGWTGAPLQCYGRSYWISNGKYSACLKLTRGCVWATEAKSVNVFQLGETEMRWEDRAVGNSSLVLECFCCDDCGGVTVLQDTTQ